VSNDAGVTQGLGIYTKKNITLKVELEMEGKRDSMLSEKRTTSAMLTAPSSRTTASRGQPPVETPDNEI
jgi:hypothetical protein